MNIWFETKDAWSNTIHTMHTPLFPQELLTDDHVFDDCPPPNDCPEPGVNAFFSARFSYVYNTLLQTLDSTHTTKTLTCSPLDTLALQQSPLLHLSRVNESYWLACNTGGAAQVTVLDAPTFALLEQFRTTVTLQEIVQRQHEGLFTSAKLLRLVNLFAQLGLICDPTEPMQHYTNTPSHTLSAWLHVTNACNLRCGYCYIQKSSEHMADDIAQRAINAIMRSATTNGYRHVHIKYAGGEASLRLQHVLNIHDYALEQAQKHGLTLKGTLLSNGVMLAQRTIEQLRARDIGVSLSLDGIGTYHDSQRTFSNGLGSFRYVDRTITRLLANGLVPSVNVTVSQRNLPGLIATLGYILERDLPFKLSYYRENEHSAHLADLHFKEDQMIAGMLDAFAYIEKHLPRRRLLNSLIDKASTNAPHSHVCSMGTSYLVIDQHGSVAKCPVEIKRPVTTIDAADPLRIVRNDRTGVQAVPIEEKEGCRDCQWRYWCSGGCPTLTYRLTGRNDIKSPNCRIYQALFPAALRLEALRLLTYTPPITL
jgi:uncharacterized protein